MTDRKSNFTEAAETTLSATLSAGSTTINVTDTSAFPAVPFYITIDPGDDTKRETIYVDSAMDGTSFTLSGTSSRGQGNTSDASHDEDARVIHGPTAQAMNDLHDRIDADQSDFDAHDHDGSDSPTVATSNLTGHNKAAHDALDIDAATLDGNAAAAFAAVAGDTFTGAVTFEDGVNSTIGSDQFGEGDAHSPSVYPDGLSWMELDGTRTWAPGNTGAAVYTFNFGDANKTWQLHILGNPGSPSTLSYRSWIAASSSWGSWRTLTTAENPGEWEVDNSTEVFSEVSLTTSYSSVASVSLSIPSDWGSWKCFADATWGAGGVDGDHMDARLVIDGAAQQVLESINANGATGSFPLGKVPCSLLARRSGMTTTGSRTVSLQLKESGSGMSAAAGQIALYARAVRTS